jgi:hypothetical protein
MQGVIMPDQWVVSGPCTVAGVPPGGTVSRELLDQWSANIDALVIGGHLTPAEQAEQQGETGQGDAGDAAADGGAARSRGKAAPK